jgi:hypothetical protein
MQWPRCKSLMLCLRKWIQWKSVNSAVENSHRNRWVRVVHAGFTVDWSIWRQVTTWWWRIQFKRMFVESCQCIMLSRFMQHVKYFRWREAHLWFSCNSYVVLLFVFQEAMAIIVIIMISEGLRLIAYSWLSIFSSQWFIFRHLHTVYVAANSFGTSVSPLTLLDGIFFPMSLFNDGLCGLVVTIPGYRSRGRGPLSLVRIIEEPLEWKCSGFGLENRN